MESNVAVTLHFEDLAVQNYLFFKMCETQGVGAAGVYRGFGNLTKGHLCE